MVSIIKSKTDLSHFMKELISCYKTMFSEVPFNNPNITDEYAENFFLNTFENGLIFISLSSSRDKVLGFRTLIKSELFKDFSKLELAPKSVYLSALYISKDLRGRALGKELMDYSLNYAKKEFKTSLFYVRTRSDTPHILNLLKETGFEEIRQYTVIINEEPLQLILHEKH